MKKLYDLFATEGGALQIQKVDDPTGGQDSLASDAEALGYAVIAALEGDEEALQMLALAFPGPLGRVAVTPWEKTS